MSIVAKKRPPVIPPPDRCISSPVSVTTVSFPVAVSRQRTMRIGIAQISLKTVVNRSSLRI